MSIRFFLDSADVAAWEDLVSLGWFHGITTNPLLLKDSGLEPSLSTAKSLLKVASTLPIREMQFQAWGQNAEALYSNGMSLSNLSREITIKIAATPGGYAAANLLKSQKASVTMTACFSVSQVALACGFGAEYAAVYYGRMLENAQHADDVLDQMLEVTRDTETRLLVASIRSVEQLESLLVRGFDTFTLRPEIADKAMQNALTQQAVAEFNAAG